MIKNKSKKPYTQTSRLTFTQTSLYPAHVSKSKDSSTPIDITRKFFYKIRKANHFSNAHFKFCNTSL